MTQDDIEATKAPLMEHLVELRSRLIKALIAFVIMFALCFVFAKNIYNILVWPFVWVAGPEHSKFIYTALLEYFVTQIESETICARNSLGSWLALPMQSMAKVLHILRFQSIASIIAAG